MTRLDALARYAHTLRHLRPVQIYGRLWHRLHTPRVDPRPAPPRRLPHERWPGPKLRAPSLIGPSVFRFLGEEREIGTPDAWQSAHPEPLWLYNLHYFDDLNAEGSEHRADWHRALILRWMQENPAARGVGWDAYPTSLRIVAWMRWLLAGNEAPAGMLHSLAVQTRHLAQRLEHHLLGNHLFVNLKALLFAAAFFQGPEADSFRRRAEGLMRRELAEQILPDGGHFERSPMYHALLLEDVLDLLACARLFGDAVPLQDELRDVAERMTRWCSVMLHGDGQIALFNDATFGVAASPRALLDYARALDVPVPASLPAVVDLEDSGYTRIQTGALLFADAGPLGPDYLPAHGHADTLSFELSVGETRLIVDSGVSQYGDSAERLRQRGTSAHNTVTVDGLDSSEVWGGFRVARRARITRRVLTVEAGVTTLLAEHDGYDRVPGRVRHARTFRMTGDELHIIDSLEGTGAHVAEVRFHLAPGLTPHALPSPGVFAVGDRLRIYTPPELAFTLTPTTHHPAMGSRVPSWVLEGRCEGPLPRSWETRLRWALP